MNHYLAQPLEERGAAVKLDWWDAGHQLARGEIEAIQDWLN